MMIAPANQQSSTYLVLVPFAFAATVIQMSSTNSALALHAVLELLTVAVLFATFTTAWNTRSFSDHGFITLLGVGVLFVGLIDALHALTMPGLGLFPDDGGNVSVQLWIAARLLETATMLSAAVAAGRQLRWGRVFIGYAAVTAGLLTSIAYLGIFPDCYRPGSGLTTFKITAELVCVAVKLATLVLVLYRRTAIGREFSWLIVLVLAVSAAADACLTLYGQLFEPVHFLGHLLKAASAVLLYRATVVHTLTNPYQVLFLDLARAHRALEGKIEERTRQLLETGTALAAEIDDRHRIEAFERAIFQGANHLMIATAPDGTIIDMNPAAERALGYRRADLIGKATPLIFHDPEEVTQRGRELGDTAGRRITGFEVFSCLPATGSRGERPWTYIRSDGSRFPALLGVTPLRDARGALFGYVGIAADLSETLELRRQAASAARRLQDTIEHISEGFVLYDGDDRVVLCNERFRQFYPGIADLIKPGARFQDLVRAAVERGQFADVGANAEPWIADRLDRHRAPADLFEQKLADGRIVLVSERRTAEGGSIGIRTDITELVRAQEEAWRRGHYDALTDLPNRMLFSQRLDTALREAGSRSGRAAVLYIDLDNFKSVNETLGHQAGDILLVDVSRRLQASVREVDTVARLGADEFTVVLGDIDRRDTAEGVAKRILANLIRPITVGDRQLCVSASIGIALFPEDGTTAEDLLRGADSAMHAAKSGGNNTYRLYSPELSREMEERTRLEWDLRGASQRGELLLEYQPIADTGTLGIVGCEALVRWRHPHLGLVSPGRFIPLAEESGLISEIGGWVLRTACHEMVSVRQHAAQDLSLAVNVSVRQFQHPDFLKIVLESLDATGFPPDRLELEVTEGLLLTDDQQTWATVQGLRDAGIELSIDDFGTGYSSLSYLKRLPVRTLKIDRSFVSDVHINQDNVWLVETIVKIGHKFNRKIIAEGVERKEHLELLACCGCDLVQGYYVSPPVSLGALMALAASGKAIRSDGGPAVFGQDAEGWTWPLMATG